MRNQGSTQMSNYYVRSIATGDNNGSDWYNAYTTIQSAINTAVAQTSGTHNIYVDIGSYNITGASTINSDEISIKGGYIVDDTVVASGYKSLTKSQYNTIITNDASVPFYVYSGILGIDNVYMINNVSNYICNIEQNGQVYINDCEFNTDYGFHNSGYIDLDTSNSIGAVTFLNSYGSFNISNSSISSYINAIMNYTNDSFDISNTSFIKNSSDILVSNVSSSGLINIDTCLFYATTLSNAITISGSFINMRLNNLTIDKYRPLNGTFCSGDILAYNSIFNGSYGVDILPGNITMGAFNCNFNPTYGDTTYTSGCVIGAPNFKDTPRGDYSLLMGTSDNTAASPAIDLVATTPTYNYVTTAGLHGFMFPGRAITGYDVFLYQKANNIVFSDYMREVMMGKLMDQYDQPLNFEYNFKRTVKVYDAIARSAFSLSDSDVDWPYEWDYKQLETPEIKTINYIVPRSLVDLTNIITESYGNENYTVNLDNISMNAYKRLDKRGISFDYNNSTHTRMIVWMLDEAQTLTMRDVYNGENLASYNLLPPVHPSGDKIFIKPSGLIPYGKTATGYKFIIESDPNTIIEGIDEYGSFEWMPTDINTQYDLRGILAYKDDIFVTAVYTNNEVPEPVLIRYPNKGYYADYQKPAPYMMPLSPNNTNPTDITVYEDGTLFINDYNVDGSGMYVYQYKPRYDYALKESFNQSNVRLLLRERYEDVTLTPSG